MLIGVVKNNNLQSHFAKSYKTLSRGMAMLKGAHIEAWGKPP